MSEQLSSNDGRVAARRALPSRARACFIFLAAAMGLGAGCSAPDSASAPPDGCSPGEVVECACVDGTMGRQACTASGTYGPCEACGDPTAFVGTGAVSASGGVPSIGAGGFTQGGTAGFAGTPAGGAPGAGAAGVPGGSTGTGGVSGAAGNGGAAGTGATGGSGASTGGSDPGPLPDRGDFAAGVRISRISVNQGVDVPVMRDGIEIGAFERNAPVVEARPALIRVFLAPDAAFQARELAVRLELSTSPVLEDAKFWNGVAIDDDLNTTFNFNVPAEAVTADVSYSVSVLELQPGTGSASGDAGSRWPAQGASALSPFTTNGPFRVMLVPLQQNGFLPDLSAGRVEEYRNAFFALFPVPNMEITVHDPVTPPVTVQASGGGWSELVNYIEQMRLSEPTDRRTYYYGALAPAGSLSQFCGYGCVAGLANAPIYGGPYGRSGVGLSFFPDGSGSALVGLHEIGHTLGRPHAPCQTPDAPPGFPYPGGGIGVWGYSLVSGELKNPAVFKDLMGYCEPRWTSDYTFSAMFDRISQVNLNGLMLAPDEAVAGAGSYRVIIVGDDGSLRWGYSVDLPAGPIGPPVDVRLRDSAGLVTTMTVGYWVPFEGLDGGSLLVAERALSAASGARTLEPLGLGTKGTLQLE